MLWLITFTAMSASIVSSSTVEQVLGNLPLTMKHMAQKLESLQYSQTLENQLRLSLGNLTSLSLVPSNTNIPLSTVDQCANDMAMAKASATVFRFWAIQMFDAWGKPGAGITSGNFMWPGAPDTCRNITSQPLMPKSNDTSSYKTKQCWYDLNIPLLKGAPPLKSMLCLPESCNRTNAKEVAENLLDYIPGILKHFITVGATECEDERRGLGSDTGAILSLIVIYILLAMVFLGTAYDGFVRFRYNQRGSPSYNRLSEHSVNSDAPNGSPEDSQTIKFATDNQSLGHGLVCSWSVISNLEKIFDVSQVEGGIPVLHGLRVVAFCWIVLGHTYVVAAPFVDNIAIVPDWIQNQFFFQIVLETTFAVDVFFVISGFLVTYGFLRVMEVDGRMNWLKFYFHRWWRLTPTLALIMFTVEMGIFKHLGSGMVWPKDGLSPFCNETWYYTLTYTNNFVDYSKQCMGVSWYLANDMQFYIISPIVLILLFRCKYAGSAAILVFCVINWVSAYIASAVHNIELDFLKLAVDYTDYFDYVYIKPYARIAAYVIGMGTGYIVYHSKGKLKISKWRQFILWNVAGLFMGLDIFSLYRNHPGVIVSAIDNALCRTLWALAIGWIIVAASNGLAGYLGLVLSAKFWAPLSRLTYSAYLTHIMVVAYLVVGRDTPIHLSQMHMLHMAAGHIVIAYIVAMFVSLVFEAPFLAMERAWMKHRERRRELESPVLGRDLDDEA